MIEIETTRDERGHWIATSENLPDVLAHGDTETAAIVEAERQVLRAMQNDRRARRDTR